MEMKTMHVCGHFLAFVKCNIKYLCLAGGWCSVSDQLRCAGYILMGVWLCSLFQLRNCCLFGGSQVWSSPTLLLQKRCPSRNWILVTKWQILRKELYLNWVLWEAELKNFCFFWMSYTSCRSSIFLHVPVLIDIISARPEMGHLSAHLFPLRGIIWTSFPATDFHRAFKSLILLMSLLDTFSE